MPVMGTFIAKIERTKGTNLDTLRIAVPSVVHITEITDKGLLRYIRVESNRLGITRLLASQATRTETGGLIDHHVHRCHIIRDRFRRRWAGFLTFPFIHLALRAGHWNSFDDRDLRLPYLDI